MRSLMMFIAKCGMYISVIQLIYFCSLVYHDLSPFWSIFVCSVFSFYLEVRMLIVVAILTLVLTIQSLFHKCGTHNFAMRKAGKKLIQIKTWLLEAMI